MENLLDDKSIEGELPSSFLLEIKGMGKWILLTATIGIIVAGVLGIICFLSLAYGVWGMAEAAAVGFSGILGVLLLYFAYIQFRYARVLQWLEVGSTVHTIDDLMMYTHRAWRWIAITSLVMVLLLFLVTYLAFVPSQMEAPSVPSQQPVQTEPMMPIGLDTIN